MLGIPSTRHVPWKDRLDALYSVAALAPENCAVLRERRVTHLIVTDHERLWPARHQVPGAVLHENAKAAVLDAAKLLR